MEWSVRGLLGTVKEEREASDRGERESAFGDEMDEESGREERKEEENAGRQSRGVDTSRWKGMLRGRVEEMM